MDNRRIESPSEAQAFLDSDRFKGASQTLAELSRHLDPLLQGARQLMKTAAPKIAEAVAEFQKWNLSSEILGKTGWLPHYTTPFDQIAECGEDIEAVQSRIMDYYASNWHDVRSKMDSRVSGYKIDAEAMATFREALDAHEAGFYRCVCRVLFPEIERVFRTELFGEELDRRITYEKLIRKLVDDDQKSIDDFILSGLYDLTLFGHLTKAIRRKDGELAEFESDELVFGLFTGVWSAGDREKVSAIPNRHAAMHGLVPYSSPQNSLNALFVADYTLGIARRST